MAGEQKKEGATFCPATSHWWAAKPCTEIWKLEDCTQSGASLRNFVSVRKTWRFPMKRSATMQKLCCEIYMYLKSVWLLI